MKATRTQGQTNFAAARHCAEVEFPREIKDDERKLRCCLDDDQRASDTSARLQPPSVHLFAPKIPAGLLVVEKEEELFCLCK